MQDSEPPQTAYDVRRGHWIAEADWPTPNVRDRSDACSMSERGLALIHRRVRPSGARALQPSDRRCRRRIVAALRQPCRSPRRPAPGQRPLAVLHRRAAEPSRSSCSASPGRGSRSRPTARRASSLCGCATSVRMATVALVSRGDPESHHTPTATNIPRRSRPDPAVIYDIPLKAIAYTLPGRPPAAAGALDQLLAVDLANAHAGDDHGAFRLPIPSLDASRADTADRGRAPTRSAGWRPRHGSPTRSCASGGRMSPSRATWRREPSPTRMRRSLWGARRLPDGIEYWDDDPCSFTITEGDPLSASAQCRAHARDQAGRVANAHRDDRTT